MGPPAYHWSRVHGHARRHPLRKAQALPSAVAIAGPTRARTLATLPGNSLSVSNRLAATAVSRLEEAPESGEIQRHADDRELIDDVLQALSRNIHPPFGQRPRQPHHAWRKADTGQGETVWKLGQPHRIGGCARRQTPPGLADGEAVRLEPQRRAVDARVDLEMTEQRSPGQT